MRKKIVIFFIFFVGIIFVQSFCSLFFEKSFLNNFILVFLVLASVFWNLKWEFAWKLFIFGGLLTDLYLFYPMGFNMFSFFCCACLLFYFKKKILPLENEKPFLMLVLICFVMVFCSYLIIFILSEIVHLLGIENLKNWSPRIYWKDFLSNIFAVLIFITFSFWMTGKMKKLLDLGSKTLIIKR